MFLGPFFRVLCIFAIIFRISCCCFCIWCDLCTFLPCTVNFSFKIYCPKPVLAATISPRPPRSQTRIRTWTVAILDLHIHIDASIDFAIESSRCVDMSEQRLLGFFCDDRQIVSKSLPEVDQKSQKSDQNRHRFTSYSTLHYVASNLTCAAALARNARLKAEKIKILLAFKWKVGKNKSRNEAFKMTREPK